MFTIYIIFRIFRRPSVFCTHFLLDNTSIRTSTYNHEKRKTNFHFCELFSSSPYIAAYFLASLCFPYFRYLKKKSLSTEKKSFLTSSRYCKNQFQFTLRCFVSLIFIIIKDLVTKIHILISEHHFRKVYHEQFIFIFC